MTVTTQVVPIAEGRVNLAFVINEGDRTKITAINFVGSNAYSNGRLEAVISTEGSRIFSFLNRKDVYSADKLRADEELLRQFYSQPRLCRLPRRVLGCACWMRAANEYTVTFTVEEGRRYDFRNGQC